ncbi:hypothetical protein [Haloarcula laminariae]|uniref:hypothetical protein n=1 Tax=Haloarcula laminariae TaxID=2961577 RepID=UPI0024055873|nr:hypothetical protein [Halomicroarcula sp. FL173]
MDETKYDRTHVVFVKIPASMQDTFESGPESGTQAITDILDHKDLDSDEIEEFAWPVYDGMIFGFRAYTPTRQSTSQQTFQDISRGESLPEPLSTTYATLQNELPDSLTIRIGSLPMGIFGSQPSLGTRVVMNHDNQKPAKRDKVSGADANALFEDLSGEPFLYHASYRKSSGLPESHEYQVTVRVFLFDPTYRISTETEYADCLRYGRELDPADSFSELGTTSSLAVIDNGYYIPPLDYNNVMSAADSLPHFSSAKSLINGDTEFDKMRRGHYGASDTLEDRCAYTSLLAREIDLEHYVGLATIDPSVDPWQRAPQAYGLDIDDVGLDPDEIMPEEVTIGVDGPVDETEFDQAPATANDGSSVHWEAIKKVAVAFDAEGYDVHIVTQDTGSRPDLWVRNNDGEIFAVEVEYRTKSKAGSFYTNIIRQAVWGYKTITVMVPHTDDDGRTEDLDKLGQWALNSLAVPMKDLEATKTLLHNCSGDIVVDGKTMLLPEGVDEAKWWLTCENEYLLIHDGTVLARGDATDPFQAFDFNVPRYYKDGDRYIVEDQHGTKLAAYDDDSEIARPTLRPCHRPVDLSYLRFVESLYCYDTEAEELVHQERTAHWDVEQASSRNEKSHQQAFETFLVDHKNDDPVLEKDCRPFIKDWIATLSSHNHPGNNIYGEYRNDYYSRKRISTEMGMEHSYPGASFRYERGLVSPDLPGLETKPSFPEKWDVAEEDVLKEPLIYGLDDRSDVGSTVEDETDT